MHAASSSVMTDSGSADSRRQACRHRNHASLMDMIRGEAGSEGGKKERYKVMRKAMEEKEERGRKGERRMENQINEARK